MELRQLRYFLAVASSQNFTRAAEAVHVSQPSLSVQIGALEEELGARLFDRLGRQVILTQAGELFRDHARRVLRELELAVEAVEEVRGAQRGRLVVGAMATVNSYLIPPLVSRFKQRFPGIHLQVHALPSADVVTGLLANGLDLGICLLPSQKGRLTAIPLLDERLVLVAPSKSSIKKSRLRMQELATLPLVLMPVDYCLRNMVEAQCTEAHVQPHVVLEMTSPEGILQAVAGGAGFSILPELYVHKRPAGLSVRTVALWDPVPHHPVSLVYRSDRHQNLAAREFARLCQETVANLRSESGKIGTRKGRIRVKG